MPRISRMLLDYPYYHIITRGVQKQIVFKCKNDFIKYLEIAKKAKRKYKILIYAYCLMSNHVHLLIETESAKSMSKFMHWLNRRYSEYYNARYKLAGHLWQGRYISKPILKDQYLIDCAYYIETNPIRANIVNNITDYSWCSYKERYLSQKEYLLDDIKGDTLKADSKTVQD